MPPQHVLEHTQGKPLFVKVLKRLPFLSRNTSPERIEPVEKQEVAFRIKKCLGGRKGWKIIPTDEDDYADIDAKALRTVVNMIKELECQVKIYF